MKRTCDFVLNSKYRTLGQARRAHPEQFRLKRGPGGNYLCRWCSTEVVPPRRTFCSGFQTIYRRRKIDNVWAKIVHQQGYGCVHEWAIRSGPRYARDAVYDRDHGICAMCGKQHIRRGSYDVDHIVPVVEGGGLAGLDNLRILCKDPCHREVTAQLKERLASERRRIKQIGNNSKGKVSKMEKPSRRRKRKNS